MDQDGFEGVVAPGIGIACRVEEYVVLDLQAGYSLHQAQMPTPHLQDGAAAGQDHYLAACGLGQGISLMIETYNIDTELNQVT